MEKTKHSGQSGRMAAVFSVAAVLFSWHAGGGFATGNQAIIRFVDDSVAVVSRIAISIIGIYRYAFYIGTFRKSTGGNAGDSIRNID